MSGVPPHAKLVTRLRRTRLDAAHAALTEARAVTRRAEDVLDTREGEQQAAEAETGVARLGLVADPNAAEARLAVLDRSRFEESLAAERTLDAERRLAEARYEEDEERARLIRAHFRHDAIDTHVRALAAADVRLEEERELLDAEHRRPG